MEAARDTPRRGKLMMKAQDIAAISDCPVIENEPMSKHTTFGVGGPADFYAEPLSEKDIVALLRFAKEKNIPWTVIGDGANLLVSDKGIRGLVLKLGPSFDYVCIDGNVLVAGSATKLAKAANIAVEKGLGGLEGAATVPGSVGGGVIMNAGTNAGKVGDCLQRVRVATENGIQDLNRDEIKIGYRTTALQEGGSIITEAEFHLTPKPKEELIAEVERMKEHRLREHPPYGLTAGCTFKNPPNDHAGWMLEQAGAKNMRVGGAYVSDKHANFIMNDGSATASDILELSKKMIKLVEDKFGVKLEYEIRILGEWQ